MSYKFVDAIQSAEVKPGSLFFVLKRDGAELDLEGRAPAAATLADLAALAAKPESGGETTLQKLHFKEGDGLQGVVTVGFAEDLAPSRAQRLGAQAAAQIGSSETQIFLVASGELAEEPGLITAFALGFALRSYAFRQYKTAKKTPEERVVAISPPKECGASLTEEIDEAIAKAEIVHFARDLVNMPPNDLGTRQFVEKAQAIADPDLDVEILDEAALEESGFRGLLAVGQGSSAPSYVLVVKDKRVKEKDVEYCLVGKGVVFDSGGLSLKGSVNMRDMKMDMAGAATVLAAMKALAAFKKPAPVVGVLGLVENMPDGAAYRPSDVIAMRSGKTVEINNTDAEGRLVLADMLNYVEERYQPKAILNFATLTGAIITALGHDFAGVFSNSDELVEQIDAAASAADEEVWRMPLFDFHKKLIESKVADMRQSGPPAANSTSAARFLSEFVDDACNWAHVDIAGVAFTHEKGRYWGPGASGWGVLMLAELFASRKLRRLKRRES